MTSRSDLTPEERSLMMRRPCINCWHVTSGSGIHMCNRPVAATDVEQAITGSETRSGNATCEEQRGSRDQCGLVGGHFQACPAH